MEQRHYGYAVTIFTKEKAYHGLGRSQPEALQNANASIPAEARRTGVRTKSIITEEEYNARLDQHN